MGRKSLSGQKLREWRRREKRLPNVKRVLGGNLLIPRASRWHSMAYLRESRLARQLPLKLSISQVNL